MALKKKKKKLHWLPLHWKWIFALILDTLAEKLGLHLPLLWNTGQIYKMEKSDLEPVNLCK